MKDPLPRGLLHVGVIIDDLGVMDQCLRSQCQRYKDGEQFSQGQQRIQVAREAYADAKLERNPKKGFLDQTHCRFWGIEIDVDKGLLRGSSTRLWPAILITLRTASLGLATVSLLESLAGTWIALLTPRRRMLCLMDNVFGALAVEDQSAVIRLSKQLIDELVGIAILAPLAAVDLRAEAMDSLIATDACLSGLAAVSAKIRPCLSQELCRTSLLKGRWVSLLNAHDSWLQHHALLEPEDTIDEPYTTHPLWEACARGLKFSETWRQTVSKSSHINVLELKAHLKEERRIAVQNPGKR